MLLEPQHLLTSAHICLLQLFYGNVDKDTPVMNQFTAPVVARYMRILPQSWNGSLCLRAEVMACQLPSQYLHMLSSSCLFFKEGLMNV